MIDLKTYAGLRGTPAETIVRLLNDAGLYLGTKAGSGRAYGVIGGYTQSSTAQAAGRMYLTPVFIPDSIVTTGMVIRVGTAAASSVARLGIYKDDGTGMPGGLVAECDATCDTSTTGVKTAAVAVTLAAGLYWMACAVQGGAPTLWHGMGRPVGIPPSSADPSVQANGYNVDSITAALPQSAGATYSVVINAPCVVITT